MTSPTQRVKWVPVLVEEQQQANADHLKDNEVFGNIQKVSLIWQEVEGEVRQVRLVHRNSFVDDSEYGEIERHVEADEEQRQCVK